MEKQGKAEEIIFNKDHVLKTLAKELGRVKYVKEKLDKEKDNIQKQLYGTKKWVLDTVCQMKKDWIDDVKKMFAMKDELEYYTSRDELRLKHLHEERKGNKKSENQKIDQNTNEKIDKTEAK